MMRARLAALALVAALLAPHAAARQAEPVTVLLIAVRDGEFLALPCDVYVSPGDGEVRVEGARVDDLFYYSAVAAARVAAISLGYDPYSIDVAYVVRAGGPIYLTGPSASLPLAAGVVAALTGGEPRPLSAATGMICPDGTVGHVARVYEKGLGLQRMNYTLYIYPAGQEYERSVRTVERRVGLEVVAVEEFKRWPSGVENLTIAKLPVGTLAEAAWGYTRVYMPAPPAEEAGTSAAMPPEFVRALSALLRELEVEVLTGVGVASALVRQSRVVARYPEVVLEVNGTATEALKYVAYSRELENRGLLLVALEALLQAYMREEYARLLAMYYYNGLNAEAVLADAAAELATLSYMQSVAEVDGAGDALLLAHSQMLAFEAQRLNRIGSLGLSAIGLARSLFGAAKASIGSLAQASALAKLAYYDLWMMGFFSDGLEVGHDSVSSARDKVLRVAEEFLLYGSALSVRTRVASPLFGYASSYLGRARWAANATYVSLAYAAESIAYSSAFISLYPGFPDTADIKLPYVRHSVRAVVHAVGDAHPLVQYYLERAQVMEESDAKILAYEKAYAYALALKLLRGGANARPGGVGR